MNIIPRGFAILLANISLETPANLLDSELRSSSTAAERSPRASSETWAKVTISAAEHPGWALCIVFTPRRITSNAIR
jgi:hypothetical protein